MCGIFTLLNNDIFSSDFVKTQFEKGKNRGPESSKLQDIFIKATFGFHRLAINGLNEGSNQPFQIDHISLICNGEIYNYKELYKFMDLDPETDSDCEVILHLYKKYGIEQTLTMLDGVFAFILCDYRNSFIDDNEIKSKMYIGRDPYGVRPLYYLSPVKNETSDNNMYHDNRYGKLNNYSLNNSMYNNKYTEDFKLYGFSSELKCLHEFQQYLNEGLKEGLNEKKPLSMIKQFTPGTYSEFEISNKAMSSWKVVKENVVYHTPSFSYQSNLNHSLKYQDIILNKNIIHYCKHIKKKLIEAVNKRCLTTERPIACLLSGGLDSSLITALVNEYQLKNHPENLLETYSIGLEGSVDLYYAKKVAKHLNTKHTEIIVTEQEMFDVIPEVIQAIESYDTTTVRASIGNYLLGKYISKNSDAKVIFNGDGSDEICGGYLYMNRCPDGIEFDKETRRLLKDIHLFDVLRSDKSISSHGLEPRTPFLDRSFVNYYLSIPHEYRFHKNLNICEKYLLRKSFDYYFNISGNHLLPEEILWRRKEAFSDGVSCQGRSLFEILQEKIAEKMNLEANIETEKLYYKSLFDDFYPNQSHILPYFWMPKYTDAKDPSARTLEIY